MTKSNSEILPYPLIPSFVTDLSSEALNNINDSQSIQFILFFLDMKNERTWRICKRAIAETPISFTVWKSCVVVNDYATSIRHAFDAEELREEVESRRMQCVPFSNAVRSRSARSSVE